MGQPEKRSASESSDTGILWSWEDRGNGLFTFLVGGASRQGWTPGTGGKLATRMHNHSEVRGSSLWEDRHSQPIRIRTNWHWTVREGHGSQKKGRTCRCWMTEGTVGKKAWVLVPSACPDHLWADCSKWSTQSALHSFPIATATGSHFYAG